MYLQLRKQQQPIVMRKIITLILCLSVYSGTLFAQSMTDDQVIQYVKQAQAAGKSQNQMAIELRTKGVTPEQVERIKKKYESAQDKGKESESAAAINRNRTPHLKTKTMEWRMWMILPLSLTTRIRFLRFLVGMYLPIRI